MLLGIVWIHSIWWNAPPDSVVSTLVGELGSPTNVEVTNAEWTHRRTTKRRMPKRRRGQNVEWKKGRIGQNVEWN